VTVYDTRQRCPYCRRFDLPCNDAVHGNPLFPYLSAVENAIPPVVPGVAETMAVRGPVPLEPVNRRQARAHALSTVALAMIGLCAVIVTLVAYIAVTGLGDPPCGSDGCAPVQLVSVPPSPRPLPTDR